MCDPKLFFIRVDFIRLIKGEMRKLENDAM